MKINNIFITGKYTLYDADKQRPGQLACTFPKSYSLWNNTIKINSYRSFNLYLTREIRYFLLDKGLEKHLKDIVESCTGERVKEIRLVVKNVHYSCDIYIKNSYMIKNLLQEIDQITKILEIEVSQEQDVSNKVNLKELLEVRTISFINLKVKVEKTTIKFQTKGGKKAQRTQEKDNRKGLHVTIIISELRDETEKLISLMQQKSK